MEHLKNLQHKFTSPEELTERIASFRQRGKMVVFTNGCFDILHKGHVMYLAKAAEQGDVLVLGLNSDASVKRQGKGEERPINPYDARATVLAGLGFVDLIVEFDEETPIGLIELVVPDVLVKGGDYDPEEEDHTQKSYIVGRDVVLAKGGTVTTIPLVDGFSTTGIIKKLRR